LIVYSTGAPVRSQSAPLARDWTHATPRATCLCVPHVRPTSGSCRSYSPPTTGWAVGRPSRCSEPATSPLTGPVRAEPKQSGVRSAPHGPQLVRARRPNPPVHVAIGWATTPAPRRTRVPRGVWVRTRGGQYPYRSTRPEAFDDWFRPPHRRSRPRRAPRTAPELPHGGRSGPIPSTGSPPRSHQDADHPPVRQPWTAVPQHAVQQPRLRATSPARELVCGNGNARRLQIGMRERSMRPATRRTTVFMHVSVVQTADTQAHCCRENIDSGMHAIRHNA